MEPTNPKLIEAIYDATLDIDQYDKLLDMWEVEFLEASSDVKYFDRISQTSQNVGNAVESHFFRAFSILDQLDQAKPSRPTIKQLIEADPLPAFLVSQDKKVILVNQAAQKSLSISENNVINQLPFEKEVLAKITDYCNSLDDHSDNKLLSAFYTEMDEDNTPTLFAVSKQLNETGGEVYLQFTTVQTSWSSDTGKTIQAAFELTDAELELARHLVRGESLSNIAESKNRSINTIRTQSKTLLRKTKAHSQGELIGILSAIHELDKNDQDLVNVSNSKATENYLIRENDRSLYYEIYGDPNGRPVLFMHGSITGTKLTKACQQYLSDRKVKLIAPHRAAFGKSQVSKIKDKKQVFINDIGAILEAEKVDKFSVIGHHAGSYYSYILGNHFSDRIEKITIINGAVPYKSSKQVREMKPRQRIITYTARYAPSLLPFLLRGAKASVDKDGGAIMLEALFEDSAFDHGLFSDPETYEIIRDGVASCFQQGVESFKNDAAFICEGNWENLILDCSVPMDVFHADKEPAVPLNQSLNQFSIVPKVEVEVVEGGQMILHKYHEKLLQNI